MPHADVAFVGVQYIGHGFEPTSVRGCTPHACVALQWTTQVWRLAGHLAAHGLSTRVHLWTPCLRADDAASMFNASGPPVFVHNHPPRELEIAVRRLRRRARAAATTHEATHWQGKGLFLLLKWAVVGLSEGLAVFLDLDMEVMPRGLDPRATGYALEAPAALEWLRVLRCANGSGWSLLSLPDHSSPVNTAFLIVKPSRTLYLEGITALHRAADGAFNVTHGWDLVGPPSRAVPPLDDSRARWSEMRSRDDWGFVCAALDQGFFFFMARVAHQVGADLGHCPSPSPWTLTSDLPLTLTSDL